MPLEPILGETLWKRVWVRDWGFLLGWELLIHVEGMVVHHEGHEHGQEPGDELHLLGQEKTQNWSRTAPPLSCTVPHPSPTHLTSIFPGRHSKGLALLPTSRDPTLLIFLGPTDPIEKAADTTPPQSHYHLGLLEDLAVNHVPRPLA